MEAFHCLQDQHKHCGEAYADDEDIPMPSIDELEGILQWPQRPLDAVTTAIAPTINARVTSATPVATSTKKKRSNGESGGKAKSTKDDKKAKKGGDGKKYPYMIRPHGRRGLSFVAPETDLEYDKYIVDGVFQTSQCPVVDLSLMYSPSDTPGNSWYKENSLLRTRGAIHWMNKVRPLQLKEAVQTKPAISIKAKAVRGGGKGKENSLSQTKMRSSFSSVDNDVSVDLADGHVDVERSENRSSLSSAHTVSAGCTKFFAGEGVIHSRSVDMSSPLLLMYTVDAELRKKVLRAQLTRIDSELDKLIQAAVRRQQGGFQEEADLDGSSGVESEDDMDVEQSPESATQEGSSFKSEYTDTRSVQRRVAGSDPLAFI